jgi:osmotically-inducible protein OsmY
MINENTITDEIRAGYARDPRLPHPAEVAVSERNSTVMLRGTVASFRQRRAAVEIAKSVRGVDVVEDELSVDPRDRWEDAEIKGAALQALISDDDVPDEQLDVHVSAGWLTLRGEVKHQRDSDAAFEAVSGLQHVGGITNKITVFTAGGW